MFARIRFILAGSLLGAAALCRAQTGYTESVVAQTVVEEQKKNMTSAYEFSATALDGTAVTLDQYKGKVALFVNTASQCGFTPQYAGLEELYRRFKENGFVVLGFPSNEFGGQEPGSNEDIKTFCETKFAVTFPMFAKGLVKGPEKQGVYEYLTTSANPTGEVAWNFEKFLVGADGKVIGRFKSSVKPEGDTVVQAVESALAQPVKQ